MAKKDPLETGLKRNKGNLPKNVSFKTQLFDPDHTIAGIDDIMVAKGNPQGNFSTTMIDPKPFTVADGAAALYNKGFRLEVTHVPSNRTVWFGAFIENFSDEYLFDEYIAPNIYLYAGKFYNKNDAYHFKEKISSVFHHTMVIPKGFPHSNIKQKKGNQN